MSEFPYKIVVGWSRDDGAFVARVPALPGAAGDGPTPEDAVRETRASALAQLETRREYGDPIPPPDFEEPEFSGQIRIRMPKSLHRDLAAAAEREGVSLNQLMGTYLAKQLAVEHGKAAAQQALETKPAGSENLIPRDVPLPAQTRFEDDALVRLADMTREAIERTYHSYIASCVHFGWAIGSSYRASTAIVYDEPAIQYAAWDSASLRFFTGRKFHIDVITSGYPRHPIPLRLDQLVRTASSGDALAEFSDDTCVSGPSTAARIKIQ